MESQRFVHASYLRLDQPLVGLARWQGISREMFRDATLLAFRRVIDFCLAEQVDFLLLTGECWSDSHSSFRAAREFQTGCERLAAAGISVVIQARDLSKFEAGLCGIRLPGDFVSVIRPDQAESRVARSATSLAVFLSVPVTAPITTPRASVASPTDSSGSTDRIRRIGLLNSSDSLFAAETALSVIGGAPLDSRVEFIADGCQLRGRTLRLGSNVIHAPGPPQGLSSFETGSCGCTLVEFGERTELSLSHHVTAPLRWEQWHAGTPESDQPDALIAGMLDRVIAETREEPDSAWLVSWNLDESRLPVRFWDRHEELETLLREVDRQAASQGIALCSQRIVLIRDESSEPVIDPLWEDFDRVLAERSGSRRDVMRHLASRLRLAEESARSAASLHLGGLPAVQVLDESRMYGRKWLGRKEASEQ